MLSLDDLNPRKHDLTEVQLGNLIEHCEKLNVFKKIFGYEMKVCSGVRSLEEHEKIYRYINTRRAFNNLESIEVPLGSMHLLGLATDFEDRMCYIYDFCQRNVSILEKIGIWVENVDYTKGWVHLQTRAPRSGARFFIPY